MIKLLEDNTVLTPDENVNSGHSHKALTPLTKALAEAFLYPAITDATRPASELIYEELRYDTGRIHIQTRQVNVTGEGEDRRIIKLPPEVETVNVFDDLTGQPQRVQDFASLVFTDEAKVEFIDSLSTVDVPQMTQEQGTYREPASQSIEVKNGKAIVTPIPEGPPIPMVTPEDEPIMVDVPVLDTEGEPVVDTFIVYENKQYTREELLVLVGAAA